MALKRGRKTFSFQQSIINMIESESIRLERSESSIAEELIHNGFAAFKERWGTAPSAYKHPALGELNGKPFHLIPKSSPTVDSPQSLDHSRFFAPRPTVNNT